MANNQGSSITILLGNGDGTFQAGQTTDLSSGQPYLVAAGDFNGDGILDVAVACLGTQGGSGFVTILLGNGDGTFVSNPASFGAIGQPAGLALADFDLNGTLDLAVSDAANGEVWILSGHGDGTFSSGTAFSTQSGPGGVVAADFNNDGKTDLAIAYPGASQVSVLINNETAGTLAFSSHQEYATGGPANFLAAADVNGDGILDLAVPNASSNSVSVLLGSVSGGVWNPTLPPPFTVDAGFNSVIGVAAADLNADGRTDLAFTAVQQQSGLAVVSVLLQTPQVTISPTNLDFAPQLDGTKSAAQTVTLTYTGGPQLTIYSIDTTANFSETNDCPLAPAVLAYEASCTVNVYFTPGASGTLSGQLQIADNVTGQANPQAVSLSGTGVELLAGLSPASLSFGNQFVGTTSVSQTVTVSNTGTDVLAITGITLSNGFTQSNNCGSFVPAGSNCAITVSFAPTASGAANGTLTVTDNSGEAPGSRQTVSLSGTGIAPAGLAPASVTFANQLVGSASATQTLTVSNSNSTPLSITDISVTGGNYPAADIKSISEKLMAEGLPWWGVSSTIYPKQLPIIPFAGNGVCRNRGAIVSLAIGEGGIGYMPGDTLSILGSGGFGGQVLVTAVGAYGSIYGAVITMPGAQYVVSDKQLPTFGGSGDGTATVVITEVSEVEDWGGCVNDFFETSTCGTTLAAGATCTISVSVKPTAAGTRIGAVTITSSATGTGSSTQSASLTGTGIAPAGLTPSSLTFGSQTVGVSSATQTLTLSNANSVALSITSVAVAGPNGADFADTNSCPTSLAAGASCTITVSFKPEVTGTRTGTVSITENASGAASSTQSVSLSGTGAAPVGSLAPTSLTFAKVMLETTSAIQKVTLSNTGTATLTIASVAITGANSGDFAQTNTCGSAVTAGASRTINVSFTPTATGFRSGTLTVTDNSNGAWTTTQTASLSGTSVSPQASVGPSSLTFPGQLSGSTSAAQAVTLSNTGTAALTVSSITASGDFAQTNNCGTSVAAGANCAINVTFAPANAGTLSGSLTITDNSAGVAASTQTVSLTGTGTAPGVKLSATSLSFGNENVGAQSAGQAVTITNTGTATLTLTSIAAGGDFSQSNTCGSSLTAGASCTVTVTFKPTATFSRTGTLGSPTMHRQPLRRCR